MGLHSGLDVLYDRHFFEQADVLERPGNARVDDLMRLFSVHPLTAEIERALGRLVNAGNQVKDRCFACAVGADEADQFGLADLHVEVIHSFQAAELDTQMLGFQYGCCHIAHAPFLTFALGWARRPSRRVRLNSHRPKMPPGRNSMTSTSTTE